MKASARNRHHPNHASLSSIPLATCDHEHPRSAALPSLLPSLLPSQNSPSTVPTASSFPMRSKQQHVELTAAPSNTVWMPPELAFHT